MTQPAGKGKHVFPIAGKAAIDPSGQTNLMGVSSGINLTNTAIGHPILLFSTPDGAEYLLEADVYMTAEQELYVHLLCPRCLAENRENALRISATNKKLHYDPMLQPKPFPGWTAEDMAEALKEMPAGAGGLLSVEKFGCTWEATPDLRRSNGLARCPWTVRIDENIIRDAR